VARRSLRYAGTFVQSATPRTGRAMAACRAGTGGGTTTPQGITPLPAIFLTVRAAF